MQRAIYFDVTFYVNTLRFYPLKLLKRIDNKCYVIVHYLKNKLRNKLYLVKTMPLHRIQVLKNASEFFSYLLNM